MDVRSVSQSAFALISVFFERKTLKQYSVIGRSSFWCSHRRRVQKTAEAKTIRKISTYEDIGTLKRFVKDTDHKSLNRKNKVRVFVFR